MLSEFKAFAMKGNVIDLAVGVVIGSAFGAIVTSLVGDIIMPIVGMVTGGVDFSGLAYTVGKANIAYGKFLQAAFVFLVVAWALFMVVKAMNKLKKAEETKPAAPPEDVVLLREIRDALKHR
jgi:large conductance mechanosensitive channel